MEKVQFIYKTLQHLTHYQMTNFRLFEAERVCRRQFQTWWIGRKLSKRVENTVGKGDIARYKQFLLFPQCFQKACFLGSSKGVIVWEWVNLNHGINTFSVSMIFISRSRTEYVGPDRGRYFNCIKCNELCKLKSTVCPRFTCLVPNQGPHSPTFSRAF